ncbi:hypothetical protein PMZ80_008803 [Knufia obscura]|uniref:A to I editase domain-containing protein n=1 Tax=Knufia obscura TaxID=1635080 RepID=A0ABR0REE5_9EURO|nr:hypothetical protein PMZ80_008803 [Knufia obscura]
MSDLLTAQIVDLALKTFTSLPTKCKPRTQADGSREWTPMSAIVLNHSSESRQIPGNDTDQLQGGGAKLISLATGTKSLPVSALPRCNGLVLHDCHAEILALRGLNRWLLSEIECLLRDTGYQSQWLETTHSSADESTSLPPFRFRQGVEISLFSTEAPCGDASMELLMAAAEAAGQDISPWPSRAEHEGRATKNGSGLPLGRGFFSNLGALRRKPARADAELSMSKSCTDKLMLKQFTGLLSFPLDSFIQRTPETFLTRVIVYQDQFSATGYARALGPEGRLRAILAQDEGGACNTARFFEVCTLPSDYQPFEFGKQGGRQEGVRKNKASKFSALWVAGGGGLEVDATVEVLVNGVKQGFKQFDERERKGSVTCRRNMVRKEAELRRLLMERGIAAPVLESGMPCNYSDAKSSPSREHRNSVKQLVLAGLGGWPKEYLRDDFDLDISSSSIQ